MPEFLKRYFFISRDIESVMVAEQLEKYGWCKYVMVRLKKKIENLKL